ncbi:MAG: sigma-70 family RNA polymerase sigma factor [Clostridia bacterium]|nr:sigma-70 family RNA polymerase sigma factor [Clostridia bacterium]
MTEKQPQPDSVITDEQLALLAQQGDGEAERALVERMMPVVQLRCRRYFLMGGDSSDLEQEASIGLISAIRDYTPEKNSSFRAYADTCIKNTIYAAIKKAARKKHMPLNSSLSLDRQVKEGEKDGLTFGEQLGAPESSDPEAVAIMREEAGEFVRALKSALTGFEHDVLTLFLDGRSYQQIAAETGRTRKAVDNALQRVKKKVIALLDRND